MEVERVLRSTNASILLMVRYCVVKDVVRQFGGRAVEDASFNLSELSAVNPFSFSNPVGPM
jgi:hypothetical protein